MSMSPRICSRPSIPLAGRGTPPFAHSRPSVGCPRQSAERGPLGCHHLLQTAVGAMAELVELRAEKDGVSPSVPICLQVNSAAHTKAANSDLAPKAWAGYSGAAFPAQMMRHASAFAAPTSCIGDAAMPYSVAEAAKAIGKRRATVLRAIVSGKISATRDEAGAFQVEPAEIHRVFPPAAPHDAVNGATRVDDASGELRALRGRLEAAEGGIRLRN